MRMDPDPADVRALVQSAFQQFGVPQSALDELFERIRFSTFGSPGRAYAAGELTAEWLMDEGVLRIFDAGGRLLRCINLWREAPKLCA